MLDEPPEDTIASITSVLLAIQPQYRRRYYAGYSPGVRRKLDVCDDIAKDIAYRYLFPVSVTDGERVVQADELAMELSQVLRSIPADQAFHLVSKDFYEKRDLTNEVGRRMAARMTSRYQLAQVDNTARMLRVSQPGPSDGETALADLRRRGELCPRYKWRKTHAGSQSDFTGYDNGKPFARIWNNAEWYWQCFAEFPRKLNSPPDGMADINRQAARDAENYYDALKRHNDLMAGE